MLEKSAQRPLNCGRRFSEKDLESLSEAAGHIIERLSTEAAG